MHRNHFNNKVKNVKLTKNHGLQFPSVHSEPVLHLSISEGDAVSAGASGQRAVGGHVTVLVHQTLTAVTPVAVGGRQSHSARDVERVGLVLFLGRI